MHTPCGRLPVPSPMGLRLLTPLGDAAMRLGNCRRRGQNSHAACMVPRARRMLVSSFVCFVRYAVLLACWLWSDVLTAADLTIALRGLRNTQGYLRLSLYDRPETFLQSQGRIARLKVEVQASPMTVQFRDLLPGKYAVTVHHDEDGDGKLQRNFLGLPLEGYGFSNNASTMFGPPSFSATAILLGNEDTTITIVVRY